MLGHVQRALAAVVALGVMSALGCGPVIYVNQVTRKASASVAAAEVANAQKYAPYHYTLAVEYLHKAREEAAHADYQAANRFGRKAEEAARKAVEQALANAADPDYTPPETLRGDGPAPAGGGDDSGGDGLAPLLPDGADDGADDGSDGDGGGDGDGRAGDGDDDEDER